MLKLLVLFALVALASAGRDGYCNHGGSFDPELSGIYRIGDIKGGLTNQNRPEYCLRLDDFEGDNTGKYIFACDYVSSVGQRLADVRGYWNVAADKQSATLQFFGIIFGGRAQTRFDETNSHQYLLDYTFEFTRDNTNSQANGADFQWKADPAGSSGTLTKAGTTTPIALSGKSPDNGPDFSHYLGFGYKGLPDNVVTGWGWVNLVDGRPDTRDFLWTMDDCVEHCEPGEPFFPQVTGRYNFGSAGAYFTYDGIEETSTTLEGTCEANTATYIANTWSGISAEIRSTEAALGSGPACTPAPESFPSLLALNMHAGPRTWDWQLVHDGAFDETVGTCAPVDAVDGCLYSEVKPLTSVFETTIDATLVDGVLELFVSAPYETPEGKDEHNYVTKTEITFLNGDSDSDDCDYPNVAADVAKQYWDDTHTPDLRKVIEGENNENFCKDIYTANIPIWQMEECTPALRVYCTETADPAVDPSAANPTCDETLCQADTCYKVYEFEFSVDRHYKVEAHTLGIKSDRLAGDEHRIIVIVPWIQKAEVTFDIAGPIDVQWAAVIPLLKYELDEFRANGQLNPSSGKWSFEVKTGLRMPFMLVEGEAGGLLERQNPGAPLAVDYEISDHADGCVYTDGADVQDQVCTQTISVTFDNCDDLVDRYTYKFSELYYTCKEVVDDMGVASQLYWPEFCLQDPPTKEADLIVDIQGTQSCSDIREEVTVGSPTLETYEQDWESPIKTYLFGDDLVRLRFEVQAPAGYEKQANDPDYCYGFPSMDKVELISLQAGQKFKGANDDVDYKPFDKPCVKYEGTDAGCDQSCVYCCTIDPADIENLEINPNDAVTWWSVKGVYEIFWTGFQSKREIKTPDTQETAQEATMKFLLNGNTDTSGFEAVKPLFFLAALLLAALLF